MPLNKLFQHFKFISFNSTNYRNATFLSGLLALLIFGAGIRLYPDIVHPRLEANLEAKAIVQIQIKNNLKKSLLTKNPSLGERELNQLVEKIYLNQPSTNNPDRLKSEKRFRKILLQQKMNGGLPLLEADPYYYLGLTRHLLKTGKLWDIRSGRDYFNSMMLAPTGCYYPIDFHPVVGLILHKSFILFNSQLSLEQTVRWVPILLTLLTLVLFIWVGARIYHLPTLSLLLGGLHLSITPIYLKRSLIGWYDTDPYNVLFPLLITVFFGVLSTKKTLTYKVRYSLALTTGFTILLYSLFWRGWSLVCVFLFVIALFSALFQSICTKTPFRTRLFSLLIALTIPLIGSWAFWSADGLAQEFTSFHRFVGMLKMSSFPLWPDIFITVGELRSPGFLKATFLTGGLFSIIITFSMLIFKFGKDFQKNRCVNVEALYLFVVCLGVFLFSVSVERFALLATAPLSIGFMVAIQHLGAFLTGITNRILSNKGRVIALPKISLIVLFILFVSLGETFIHGYRQIYRFRPIYNVSWDRVMKYISSETALDSIITTWWSPGHFITSKGQRGVSFDGATQNETRAYWIARLFMEPSEPVSVGILRMLNTTGEQLQQSILELNLETSATIRLINQIIPFPKTMIRKVFDSKFEKASAVHLTELAFSENAPPPSYLFIYKHMMDQIQALEYVGFWDFKKSELFNQVLQDHPNKIPSKALKRGNKQYVKFLWAMTKSPTPTPKEGVISHSNASLTYFTNNVSIGNTLNSARIDSDIYGKGKPSTIYYVNGNTLFKEKLDNPDINVALIFVGDNLSPETLNTAKESVLLHPRLADSLAVRLYWLQGAGLRFIKPVFTEKDVTKSSNFVLYQIDWESYYKFMDKLEQKLDSRSG